ncbi:MAG: MMPL family transporter [Marmoricola sp.]
MHRRIAGKLTGRRTKWLVLLFWVIAVVGLGSFAGKLTGVEDNQAKSWLPANAESTRALDKLDAFRDKNDIPTTLVYERDGALTRADLTRIARQVDRVQRLHGAVPVTTPQGRPVPAAALVQRSKDGEAAQATVHFNLGSDGWNKLPGVADRIHQIARIKGVTFHLAGAGGQAADSAEAFSGLDGKLLFSTIGVVILILLLTYRSPVLWLLPVISAGTALAVSQGAVYFLARDAGMTVNGQSQGILTVLVFGAGTDYALLLVARYREELRRHQDRHEAMAFALHRAAPAIIASALTVVLGMLCLLAAEMSSTAGMGPVLAVGVVVALLVMVTLLPALLVITGRWVFWPARPGFGTPEPTASGLWARIGRRIAVRPRTVWVVTAVLLGVACIGMVELNAHGLSTADSYTRQFDSIKGQKVLAAHHLADTSDPVMVVANADRARQVRAAMTGITGVDPPSRPVAKHRVAFLKATLQHDPTSTAAYAAVDRLRDRVHAVDGADALVGGGTAINADIEHASARDNAVIIPLVLAVVLIVLMVLLRAVASPLLLIGTVVLSFGAALGLSSLVFRHLLGFAGADASFPLYVFVFLVALGIDYNIFLMTRVREETAAKGTREGSLVALATTGGVITSAGLVLAATFAVLATMPLVAFAEVGLAVALGVLLDTIVVRSVLVTALNLDLGSRIWWPSRLDRGGPAVGQPAAETLSREPAAGP